jgi:hypothetical protein
MYVGLLNLHGRAHERRAEDVCSVDGAFVPGTAKRQPHRRNSFIFAAAFTPGPNARALPHQPLANERAQTAR